MWFVIQQTLPPGHTSGKPLPMAFPPTESVAVSHPRRVRRATRCSSWMTPMQHTRIRAYCQSARTHCSRTVSVYRAPGHARSRGF